MVFVFLLFTACSDPQTSRHYVQDELEVWVHYGNEAERRTIQQQVARFNDLQDSVRISAVILPSGVYHDQVEAAALKGHLPDILEIDPAYVGYRAWQHQLLPIDKLLSDSLRLDLLGSLLHQNMYLGRIYALSTNGRIEILYARRSLLEQAGVTTPILSSVNGSHKEQMQMLNDLLLHLADEKGRDPHYGNSRPVVIEVNSRQGQQWLAEMLLPLLTGRLDRPTPLTEGINGPKTLALLQQIQHWFVAGYLDDQPDDAFIQGQVPLAVATQAEFDRYYKTWKDDLLVVPLTGSGSGQSHNDLHPGWSWGISRDCRNQQSAMRFIGFLLQPEEILMMAEASAMLPASRSALQMSSYNNEQGPDIDTVSLDRASVPLTASPAYPQLRARVYQLIDELSRGQDVRQALARSQADFEDILAQYQEVSLSSESLSAPRDAVMSSAVSAND